MNSVSHKNGKNTEYFSLIEQASAEGQHTELSPGTSTFVNSWFILLKLEILFSSAFLETQAQDFYSLDCVQKKSGKY